MKNSDKLFSYFLIIGLVVGMAISKIFGKSLVDEAGIYGTYFFEKLSLEEIVSEKYLLFILWRRIKFFVVVYIISRLKYNKLFGYLIMVWIGQNMGMALMIAISKYGVYGVIIFAASVLPQWFIYIFIVKRFFQEIVSNKKQNIIMCIMFFCAAIIIETYLSPYLLELSWEIYK